MRLHLYPAATAEGEVIVINIENRRSLFLLCADAYTMFCLLKPGLIGAGNWDGTSGSIWKRFVF